MLTPTDTQALEAFITKLMARRPHAPPAERYLVDDAIRATRALLDIKPDPLRERVAKLETVLREIESEANKSNSNGGDDLLTVLAGMARDALRQS
jgi:hypothetical protein